jgi:hypothetical protein
MKGLKPINRDERLAYIDLFHQERDLAIDSPFHYLLFDEDLSPVLQALTLDEILSLHPIDAPIHQQVWCCSDVINFARRKQLLWQPSEQLPQLFRRRGTMMLVVPPLSREGRREAGSWETIYKG